jgi:hypothetical protein
MQQAQDTFIAVLGDGTERFVAKGEVFPDGHELVKRDQAGTGTLFRPLDLGEDEKAPAKSQPKADAKAAPVTGSAKSAGKAP